MSLLTALKLRVAGVLSRPEIGRVVGAVLRDRIPIRGCVIDTRAPGIQPEIKAMLLFRLYESAEIRFVQRYLREDLDVVELGGCLGVVSSQIAKRLRPGRRLVTVEANPHLVEVIENNVRANAPRASFVVVHAAVDSTAAGAETTLALGPLAIDGALGSDAGGTSVRVPSTTLGRILSEQAIGDYALVCDVEGAEAGILEREPAALERCRQVVIELHDTRFEGRPWSADALGQRFCALGFRRIDSHGPVWVLDRGGAS